jgi:hypothetical protein
VVGAEDHCSEQGHSEKSIDSVDNCQKNKVTAAHIHLNANEHSEDHEHEDCCDDVCACPCSFALNFHQTDGALKAKTFSVTQKLSLLYNKFYQQPYLDPAIKPPLYS